MTPGALIIVGIIIVIFTIGATVSAVGAVAMSDNPYVKFNWKWPILGAALSIGLIIIGAFVPL